MVLLRAEVPMAAYSLDLRRRVFRAWDSGLDPDQVAAKYEVSRAWVYRLVQRWRETGSLEPRTQTKFRRRALSAQQEERLACRRGEDQGAARGPLRDRRRVLRDRERRRARGQAACRRRDARVPPLPRVARL